MASRWLLKYSIWKNEFSSRDNLQFERNIFSPPGVCLTGEAVTYVPPEPPETAEELFAQGKLK